MRTQLIRTKAQKVSDSLYNLSLMAKMLLFESVHQLDADFRMPIMNNYAKRIKTDAEAIMKQLDSTGYFDLTYSEVTDEYAGECWRIFNLIVGLSLENLREFADGLEKRMEGVEV